MNRLKELRILHSLTQDAVASHIGITRAAYTNLENEKRQCDTQTLLKLSDLYSVSVGCVLGVEPIFQQKENSPALIGAEEQEVIISKEESDRLFDSFVQAGLVDDVEAFTEEDRAFFSHIIGLFDVWMRNKRA